MNNAGRKPVTVVELTQPRCTNRYGVAPCTASGPSPCYNCPGTCDDIDNLNTNGSITWRFTDNRPDLVWDEADFSDPDNIVLNPIPCGISVSTAESEINAGANIDGKSSLGVTGTVTVGMTDFPSRDIHGDHYRTERARYQAGRAPEFLANFWALWTARNELFNDMFLGIYDGYEGQTLAEMRKRVMALDTVSGPNGTGGVTLKGIDPLRLAGDKRAQFPPTSDLDLFGDIDQSETAIKVFGSGDDLARVLGNTSTKYLAINNEIIGYTGYTADGDGVYTLTGVTRAVLGSTGSEHADNDAVQRVGRYNKQLSWRVFYDLYANHTEIPAAFIPLVDWDAEGNTYLPSHTVSRTIVTPTDVDVLAGSIAQQSLFYVWWEPYAQEVKFRAVRPPSAIPEMLNDDKNLLRGSVLERVPESRLSQVTVYYGQIDPFGSVTSETNFQNRYTSIDGNNLGETRAKVVYAPWVRTRSQAAQLSVRLLLRYKKTPEFLTVTIDAKDRQTVTGDVVDIETATILDRDGNINSRRWQVISSGAVVAGQTYKLRLQTYEYVGKFASYMADGSPQYAAASAAQKLAGAFYADDQGELPDGTEGYLYQ